MKTCLPLVLGNHEGPIFVKFDVVIPVYGCSDAVLALCREIQSELAERVGTVWLIVDGLDGENLRFNSIAQEFPPNVETLYLPRRLGQHNAIRVGLSKVASKASAAVVMDCDGQDDPKEVLNFLSRSPGFKSAVVGRRIRTEATWIDSLTSRIFRRFLLVMSGGAPDSRLSVFSFLPAESVMRVSQGMDYDLHFLHALFRFAQNPIEIVDYPRRARHSGRSSYSFLRRANHAVLGMVGWSTIPLRRAVIIALFGLVGFSLVALSLPFLLSGSEPPEGWTSIVGLQLASSVLILAVLGVIGLYLERLIKMVEKRT